MKTLPLFLRVILIPLSILWFSSRVHGVDRTWDVNAPNITSWLNGSNWVGGVAPVVGSDSAVFDQNSTNGLVAVNVDGTITVGSIRFLSGADSFAITISGPGSATATTLTIAGTGVSAQDSMAIFAIQGSSVATESSRLSFINSASASSGATPVFYRLGSPSSATGIRGQMEFAGTATTGSASIENFSSNFSGRAGAFTQFKENSNAFGGTIFNNGSGFVGGQGITLFNDNSQSDATTTIVNRAGLGFGGQLFYAGQSDAGGAVITNLGGFSSGAVGGMTVFQSSQNVGSPTITNEGATAAGGLGGRTQISLSQITFNPSILNKGALVAGAFSGDTRITNASVVGPTAVIENGSGGGSGALGGALELSGTSVFQGTIVNRGAAVGGARGGVTNLLNTSSVTGLVQNFGPTVGLGGSTSRGTTNFLDSSTAGTADIENYGATIVGGFSVSSGLTVFREQSSAAGASIVNFSSAEVGGGGETAFRDSSSLGGASLVNRSGRSMGITQFSEVSQAGTGQITNEGAAVAGHQGGFTGFLDSSSAAQAFITNSAGQVDGAAGGRTVFLGSSTTGEASILNQAALVEGAQGGETQFRDNNIAGQAVITNSGGIAGGMDGGTTIFRESSSAGNAEIRNAGGVTHGTTEFFDSSTAGSAIILNLLGVEQVGGRTEFHDASTAGAATIVNIGEFPGFRGRGSTVFSGADSNAGTATITNAGGIGAGGDGGFTEFLGTSSAGNAKFFNRGGAAGGGGFVFFRDSSTAGNATFSNEAGTVGGFPGVVSFQNDAGAANGTFTNLGAEEPGLNGGATTFNDFTKAEHAILIALGGSNGGLGGRILFAGFSTGDHAQVQLSGNGQLDLEFHLGPLEIGALSGTGGVVKLGTSELTVGNLNTSTEFAGVIQGTGGLRKVGTGALNLTGINTYTGDTNIDEGAVLVNGSLASANVFVNAGGTLGGNGTLFGHVFNSGIVSPGNSVGTLNIGGNFSQDSGGTLLIEVESATSFDRLIIGGSANLDGTLRVVRLTGYQPQVGDVLRFLTASGGVNGRFGTVINPFNGLGTLVVLEVVYGGDFVQLVAVQNSFANALGITGPEDEDGDINPNRAVSVFAITPNQIATALALDSALSDPRQQEVLDFLNRQPFTSIPGLLDRIAPEELTSIYTIGFAQMDSQVLDLQQRFADIRQSAREEVRRAVVSDSNGGGGKASGKVSAPAVSMPKEDTVGFFITGSGDFASAGGTFNASGYDIESGSAMTGFDVRLREDLVVGISAGYARTEGDLVDDGELDADGGKVALYALYHFAGGLFFEGMVGGGYNTYDIERSALNGKARGDTEGSEFDAYISSGYDIRVGEAFTLTPVLSLLYTQVRVDGYEERGSLQPLYIESQHEDSLRSRIGLRASATYLSGSARITPYLRAEWQHEFLDDELDLTSRFANGSGDPFNVHGPEIGRNSFLLSGGVTVSWETVSLYLAYQADLGRENYEQHTVLAGLRKMW